MSLTKVFVYGTLKRGHPNHYLLSDTTGKYGLAKFLGGARLVNKYPMVICGRYNVPYLLSEEGRGENVVGEVYGVDSKMLEVLDDLECHPTLYTRTQVQCTIEEANGDTTKPGDVLDCEIYMIHNFKKSLLSAPFLSDYSFEASKDKPYSGRADREKGYDVIGEVKEQ